MNTNHESRNEFIITLVQILVSALITLVCILCGFYLYLRHIEGGTYLIGIVTGAPVGIVAGYGMAKAGDKKPAQQPLQINATAQAGDKPDGSSVSVTSAPADTPASAPDAPSASAAVPLAFAMPALVDKDGNKLPNA